MNSYLIYRHGSNAANQSMCNKAAVAIVDAETPELAKEIAAKNLTVYNNQFLEAVAEADADCEDWNAVNEQGAMAPSVSKGD